MEYMLGRALQGKCLYCHKELPPEWKSIWDNNHHYKTLRCSCGEENWCKVPFDGSGHDCFLHGVRPLESTIARVQEK